MFRDGACVGTCVVVCCVGSWEGLCCVGVVFFNIPCNFCAYCLLFSACWVAFDCLYGVVIVAGCVGWVWVVSIGVIVIVRVVWCIVVMSVVGFIGIAGVLLIVIFATMLLESCGSAKGKSCKPPRKRYYHHTFIKM